MPRPELTPEEEAEARTLAEGDYGLLKSRFPLRFALPIYVTRWRDQRICEQRNGTVFRVNLPERSVGVTCSHVLKSYRDRRDEDPSTSLAVGNAEINLEDRLIDEDCDLDVATLSLEGLDLCLVTDSDVEIGIDSHNPMKWPPAPIALGDAVHLGGFPEAFRSQPERNVFQFETLAFGGQFIKSISPGRIAVQFEREYWVGEGKGHELRQLSGMSGGPAFVSRGSKFEYFELVGVMCQFNEGFDIVYLRPAGCIRPDGTLDRTMEARPVS